MTASSSRYHYGKVEAKVCHFEPTPFDNTRLANLCGALDENIRQISAALDVTIFRRGERFIISGFNGEQALALLQNFYAKAKKPILVDEIQLALVEQRAKASQQNLVMTYEGASDGVHESAHEAIAHTELNLSLVEDKAGGDKHSHSRKQAEPQTPHDSSSQSQTTDLAQTSEIESPVLRTRKHDLRGRTPRQIAYLKSIIENDICFGIGPAGTGKTYLAVACAVDALERDAVQRIILTRPAVEAGERLGFLPGDLAQKVDPYLRPLYDALYDLLGFDRTQKMFEKQIIEIAPLAYMRGRTLNHAFIILDEAQNTTPEQMKMFLTRIGFGSKAVVTGDVTQIDLQRHQKSGLVDACQVLRQVRGVAFSQFTSSDVVRHPIIAKIVDAYDLARKNEST